MARRERTSARRIAALILSLLCVLYFVIPQAADAAGKELVIDDTSYSLDTLLSWNEDATDLKIAVDNLGTNQVTIPARIASMQGWQKKTFFDDEAEKVRELGLPKKSGETLTFASGCDTNVKNLIFTPADSESVTISEGATVHFENCTFRKTIVNDGTATFKDCTFTTGEIRNNGRASYTGTTVEPKNIAAPKADPAPLSLSLEGTLDCVTKGQSGYSDHLDLFVTEGEDKVSYFDYEGTSDKSLTVTIRRADGGSNDSGMYATWMYDQVAVYGTPEKAGTYLVSATLKDKGQTVTSNDVELRIYNGDETLKQQFATVPDGAVSWDMEPYEIWTSDNAVVPKTLKNVYGSHESGLYGQIGNNKSVGTDTVTIPAGCDVTFENMKFNSSVKIIVEKGAHLTLSDSVAFGEIVVNGGTLTMKKSSAVTDKITLNDGSTLDNAEIVSNHTYLTDGSEERDVPSVVVVNGTVHAKGTNTIQGDDGTSKPGQTALEVNGTLVIDEGSSLTANGGGEHGNMYGAGGDAVKLNNGTITGPGALTANGGVGVDKAGGKGIAGTGFVSVGTLNVSGGDADKLLTDGKNGGDAIDLTVLVSQATNVASVKGGKGNPDGSSAFQRGEKPADEDPDDPDSPRTDTEGQGKNGAAKGGKTVSVRKAKNAPKTGDVSDGAVWTFLTLAAGAAGAAAVRSRRREEN